MKVIENESLFGIQEVRPVAPRQKRKGEQISIGRDLFLSPYLAGAVTIVLLIASAAVTRWLEVFTGETRPFTLFFLIPVAFGAAYYGIRGGLAVAVSALLISRIFLFPPTGSSWSSGSLANDIEMGALAFGTFTIAIVTGRLRRVLSQLRQVNIDLKESELARRNFNRDVLLAVTSGVLELCDNEEVRAKVSGEPDIRQEIVAPIDVSKLRHRILERVNEDPDKELRVDDLCTAVTEAASNAVKHGIGGEASVWFHPNTVQVLIEDHGPGISPAQLARATLERGYSTRVSLGMGYYMIMESVDRMALATSSDGTLVLLTVGGSSKASIGQSILSQYPLN